MVEPVVEIGDQIETLPAQRGEVRRDQLRLGHGPLPLSISTITSSPGASVVSGSTDCTNAVSRMLAQAREGRFRWRRPWGRPGSAVSLLDPFCRGDALRPCRRMAPRAAPPVSSPDRRATLLARNSGVWEGTFLRLEGRGDAEAVEAERFASRLLVEDRGGTVEAALTNLDSGSIRSMRFAEPPPEMQISAAGHWSLGTDRIGAWPWVCELCLVEGERRRRVVVRLEGERLISLVVVIEARPGCVDPPPAAPLRLPAIRQAGGLLWKPAPDLEVLAGPGAVELAWQPQPGRSCRLGRAYSEHGVLLPLPDAAGA